MYEKKEVLTREERFINVIYYIFRYSLYGIAWGFISNISNEFISYLLLGFFIYCVLAKQSIDEKVLNSIIAEERRNVVQVFTNPDYENANSPDIDEIRKSMDRQDYKTEILNMLEDEKDK